MNANRQELMEANASLKSYVGPAILVFFLYWLFWLPGLVANIMYWNEARRMQKLAGHSLSGVGCLRFMFILGLLPLLAICVYFLVPFFWAALTGTIWHW